MLVYRIEDSRGYGPFAGNETGPDVCNIFALHDPPLTLLRMKRCSINNRVELIDRLDAECNRFGWKTLEHMVQFIIKPDFLDETDYRIVVYKIDEAEAVFFDDGQVLFNHTTAEPVGGFTASTAGHMYRTNTG